MGLPIFDQVDMSTNQPNTKTWTFTPRTNKVQKMSGTSKMCFNPFLLENVDSSTVQPFVGMEWNVLPHPIAWVGEDGRSKEVNEHFFLFLKSMPSLFDDVEGLQTDQTEDCG